MIAESMSKANASVSLPRSCRRTFVVRVGSVSERSQDMSPQGRHGKSLRRWPERFPTNLKLGMTRPSGYGGDFNRRDRWIRKSSRIMANILWNR